MLYTGIVALLTPAATRVSIVTLIENGLDLEHQRDKHDNCANRQSKHSCHAFSFIVLAGLFLP